jgi:tetratricopeptide (TPR) repeat protein
MMEKFWERLSLAFSWMGIIVLLVLVTLASNVEIKDMDLWLHLASGQFILEHRYVPDVDIFSATIAGKPWLNHEWLFQIVIALVHGWGGFEGLITMQVLVVGLTFAMLLWWGLDKKNLWFAVYLLFFVAIVYQLRLTIRPDIFSLFFFCFYVFAVTNKRMNHWPLWSIFLVQILWVNMHGFFVFGPLILAVVFLSECAKQYLPLPFEWKQAQQISASKRWLSLAFLISMAACFFNPYFIDGALYPFKVLISLPGGESKIFFELINELQNPIEWSNVFSLKEYPFYKLLLLISGLSFIFNYRRIDPALLAIWGIVLMISLSAVRNVVFFSITAYFVTMINARDIRWGWIPEFRQRKLIARVGLIVFQILLIIQGAQYIERISWSGYYDFDTLKRKSEFGGISRRNFPYKAADFLAQHEIKGRFFNDFNSGAYLIGRVYPNIKVFIDGRTEVYGVDVFNEYRNIFKFGDTKSLEELVEKYHLTGAFLNFVYVPVSEKLINYLYHSDSWVLVYFDYDAAIFLKNIPENKVWIDELAIKLDQWQVPQVDILRIGLQSVSPYRNINRAYALLHMKLFSAAEQEVAQALKLSPDSAKAYEVLGKIALENKNYQTAYEQFRKSKLLDAPNPLPRYYVALSLFHLNRLKEAQEHCQKVIPLMRGSPKPLLLMLRIHVAKNEYEKAMEDLTKLKEMVPQIVDDLKEIAASLLEQNRQNEALRVYQFILEADPALSDVQEKINQLRSS